MGQNGDAKKADKKPAQGNKKRPFKFGPPPRANSAASSEVAAKYPASTKLNRLRRSQSVENASTRKNDVSRTLAPQQETRSQNKSNMNALQITSLGNNSSNATELQQSHSEGKLPLSLPAPNSPKKRRPFSFSRNFHANESIKSWGGGGDDYELVKKPQPEIRSPRVHFADTLELDGKSVESKNDIQTDETTANAKNAQEITRHHLQRTEKVRSASFDSLEHFPAESKNLPLDNEQKVEITPITNKYDDSKPNPNPTNDTLPQTGSVFNDKLFIAKTDDLIMEVARFITEIKANRTHSFPVDVPPSQSEAHYRTEIRPEKPELESNNALNQSKESLEGLFDISCPSIVQLQSARSNISFLTDNYNRKEEAWASRPASAASFIRSVSNEDIHGRIALTLQMIEQEEKREMCTRTLSIPEKLHCLEDVDFHSLKFGHSSDQLDYPRPQSSATASVYETSPTSRTRGQTMVNSFQVYAHNPMSHRFTTTEKISTPRQDQGRTTPRKDPLGSSCSSSQSSVVLSNTGKEEHSHIQQIPNLNTTNGKLNDLVTACDSSNEKAMKIFSFLDEAEKMDKETLLGLQYEISHPPNTFEGDTNRTRESHDFRTVNKSKTQPGNNLSFLQKVDSLIRKGSVELAKEQIIFERKLEESQQRIQILEETLIHQRDLNMKNLRNSDRDLKKRLKLQKEEFDVAFARNEALINEMVAEKRILQERCDKLMKHFDETEEKYKEQIKSLQQKHLDEIKRLRKVQINAEHVKKQQWVGNKTQEIREMTVKGLEPEVQRIIQRHQQEMSEMRAWHSDELRETEERCQRKLHMQLQDMREKLSKEAEEIICKEKDAAAARYESALKQREDEFESQRRRLLNEIREERERSAAAESKFTELMQENLRKVQIKSEIELENLKHEYEAKMSNMERRHSNELKSVKDIHETETETLLNNTKKKYETIMIKKETQLTDSLKTQLDSEVRERERKLREEFEKIRREDDQAAEIRIRRFQEKFSTDLQEMDQSEKELKIKLTQAKTQLSLLEEETYSLKAALFSKEKQNNDLQDANTKMLEERTNLTSVIRREFSSQIEALEADVRGMRSTLVDLQTKHKLDLEQKQLELEKMCHEKDAEIDKIGIRVQQTISRKDETIQGLQKQIDKCNFQIQHLEGLLEEQRKNLVDSMTKSGAKRK